MIESIQLCFSHRMKVKGSSEIRFAPGLNVVVGPNGTGKSTILHALNECDECMKHTDEPHAQVYFNAETMNPHAPHGPVGNLRGMVLRTRGIFASHGQIMKTALTTLPVHRGDTLLVDEPDAGQDIDAVVGIGKGFDAIVKQGGQVIAATHHPLLLRDAHLIELAPGYAEVMRKTICRSLCGGGHTDL